MEKSVRATYLVMMGGLEYYLVSPIKNQKSWHLWRYSNLSIIDTFSQDEPLALQVWDHRFDLGLRSKKKWKKN